MIKRIVISMVFISAFAGCTRDDICAEDTPTTPLLMIEFRDISARLESKAVTSLRVVTNDQDSIPVYLGESDILVGIPLNTLTSFSEFQFIANSNDTINANTDIISFTYSTQDIYVNRACGFKTIYNDLQVEVAPELGNNNWIKDFTLLTTTIEDETEAQLTIYH